VNLFSLIKKDREYWLVDQVKGVKKNNEDYLIAFTTLLDEWNAEKVGYLSLLMDEENEDWLLKRGFNKVSSIVEYTRNLEETFNPTMEIKVDTLSESHLSDSAFAELYESCRSGSANKNKLFSIDQIMESFVNELGSKWREHCYIFSNGKQALGISIPHIEEGTRDEGRLFYFGVVPEQRGKGYGTVFHLLSLEIMKRFGAKSYVGSTDENNQHMIRIFETNGCTLRDKKGIYRINRKQ